MRRPPPLIRAMPERKHFFSVEPFPKILTSKSRSDGAWKRRFLQKVTMYQFISVVDNIQNTGDFSGVESKESGRQRHCQHCWRGISNIICSIKEKDTTNAPKICLLLDISSTFFHFLFPPLYHDRQNPYQQR